VDVGHDWAFTFYQTILTTSIVQPILRGMVDSKLLLRLSKVIVMEVLLSLENGPSNY
jgi:hypothetical protein